MSKLVITATEQEYLKQIFLHTQNNFQNIQTKSLAALVKTKPSSVTDMIKKLAQKDLVIYNRHHGCRLSVTGLTQSLKIIRRNRLWEIFLFEKLEMDWKEIDEVASKLQSLTSEKLTDKLAFYLGNPTYDPHGEAIPDSNGDMPETDNIEVYDLKLNETAKIFGFRDTSPTFLEYIEKLNLRIGITIKIIGMVAYGNSLEVCINDNQTYLLTKEIAQKIFVTKND